MNTDTNTEKVPQVDFGNKLKAKTVEGKIIEFEVVNGKVNCGYKKLTEITYIPDTVIELYCYDNKLTSLPELNNITYLRCSDNKLETLPNCNKLETLKCYNNYLIELPELPNIITLDCAGNKLTTLPEMLNLTSLDCSYNKFGLRKRITNNNYFEVIQKKSIDNVQIIEF